MAQIDSRGLPLSTDSDRAAELYREGIDLLLSAWPGADAALVRRSRPIRTSRWHMLRGPGCTPSGSRRPRPGQPSRRRAGSSRVAAPRASAAMSRFSRSPSRAGRRRRWNGRLQSLNDFIVFGTMAVGSFASGGLLTAYGWDTVLWVSFAPLAIAVAALAMSRETPFEPRGRRAW